MAKYRYANIQIIGHQDSSHVTVVIRGMDYAARLPAKILPLLSFCQTFDTLENHAKNFLKKNTFQTSFFPLKKIFRLSSNNNAAFEECLRALHYLVKKELLLEETETKKSIIELGKETDSDSAKIETVGILTCDRPTSLNNALESFISNSNQNGHQPVFVVADDSRVEQNILLNKEVIKKVTKKFSDEIRYTGRTERKLFAGELSKESGVDGETVDFSIVSDANSIFSTNGSVRNSLLLESAGRPLMQVDDDVECVFYSHPQEDEGEVKITSQGTREFWYFKNEKDLLNSCSVHEDDILSQHEKYLGRGVKNFVRKSGATLDTLSIEDSTPDMLSAIFEMTPKILITYTGVAGDSCMTSHWGQLFNKGRSLKRLLYPQEDYRWKTSTRFLLQMPLRPALYQGRFCISTNMGMDMRVCLPPFSPWGRNTDAVFGSVYAAVFRRGMSVHIPISLFHNRPEDRKIENKFGARLGQNELLALLIDSFGNESFADPEKNLIEIGKYLVSMGSLLKPIFESEVIDLYYKKIRQHQIYCSSLIAENSYPEYWKDDIKDQINEINSLLSSRELIRLTNISDSRDKQWEQLQKLVINYGKLLMAWPTLVKSARKLRGKGITISQSIRN